jgi:hypothetical protein
MILLCDYAQILHDDYPIFTLFYIEVRGNETIFALLAFLIYCLGNLIGAAAYVDAFRGQI